MAWYYKGSITIAAGSNVVTGTGTQWLANLYGIGEGQALVIGNERLEIMYVDSDTSLRLALPHTARYSGSYHIETSYAGTGGDASRQISAALRRLTTLTFDWAEWMTSDAATIIATDAFGHPVEIATYHAFSKGVGFKDELALQGYTVKDKDGVTDVKIDSLQLIQQRVDSKLAKDQNGADIPNKPKFIENLGLPEKYQPKGNYQAAGNYADGAHFVAHETESLVISPDSSIHMLVNNNKMTGVWDKIAQRLLWAFDATGELTHGIVPAGRISGLGSASVKNTGNGAGQIPDMSYFASGASATADWYKLPGGLLIQSGITAVGYIGTPFTIGLPVAFSNNQYRIVASYDNARAGSTYGFAMAATPETASSFTINSSSTASVGLVYAYWIAIGRY